MTAAVRASVHTGIPEAARQLLWEIFFVEAKRGVSFRAHLPWCDSEDTRAVLLERQDSGFPMAAAVIRPGLQAGCAMIGYVGVAAGARGQGYGRMLIAAVNQTLDALDFRTALLWTGKPAVYQGQEYEVTDQDCFLGLTRKPGIGCGQTELISQPWPEQGSGIGLPAFAMSGERHRSRVGEAIVAHGRRGTTLLDWQGDWNGVVDIMDASGVDTWSVNVPQREVHAFLPDPDRFSITSSPGTFTMTRSPGSAAAVDFVSPLYRI